MLSGKKGCSGFCWTKNDKVKIYKNCKNAYGFATSYRNISYFYRATMLQVLLHKIRKPAGIFVLTTVFLSILASLSLPLSLEFTNTDQEPISLKLPEKDIKESYENPDPENETLEEIDLYQDYILPVGMFRHNGSELLFSFLTAHLSTTDVDIRRPPPQFIAA